MRKYFVEAGSGSHYRRGTIMGLTVAEAFMLVAFVLLMLLLFWRHEVLLGGQGVVVPKSQLEKLKSDVERASGVSEEHLQALRSGAVPVLSGRLEDLERRAERASGASEEHLQALRSGAVPVPPGRIAELEKLEQQAQQNPREVAEALELREALDPYGEDSNETLLARIEDLQARQNAVDSRLAEEAQARREFMDKLRRELSAPVKSAGGKIGPHGRITFPDKAFFETGSAEIPERSRQFLDNICSRWLATLKESSDRFDIDEIRIEGHSSSEWADARTRRDAWVENLGLSQQRAQSVLVHCLDHVGRTPLGDWARSKLTAVGYSSSRRLLTGEGTEDKDASRRVVLGYEISRERLISELGGATGADDGAIAPIRGEAPATDADTTEIGKTTARLDGFDAPEPDQTCIAADGSEWACVQEAGR